MNTQLKMDAEIRSEIQNEVQAAFQTTQTTILDSMTTLLDNRLECFNKSFQSTQKALAESQLAKLDETLSDNYKFKNRGNEEQHKHNSKVLVKFKEANSELNQEHLTKDNIESAKDKITEGLKINDHVEAAVLESGVTTDSPLYQLYPKMCKLLLGSRSDNTIKSYFYAFRRWEQLCQPNLFISHFILLICLIKVRLFTLLTMLSTGLNGHTRSMV